MFDAPRSSGFAKILVANRGEIACRVMHTARRLGTRCVAVYSDADAHALHVESADEAYRIGPPAARDSYLNIDAILQAARASGAQAVHPGYGFLAENAEFAEACARAGLVFIGPPAHAIRSMGSKSAAKALMAAAGIPLVPGYLGDNQDLRTLKAEADKLGYPLLIKASAGGGGKGMRKVTHPSEFSDALESCRREAAGAFGDDRVFLERYVQPSRHVEIQIFADRHGNVVHLFERDCSVQRRHQKVLEESPAPGLTAETRSRMGAAAVAAARSVGYVGAGTVEFLFEANASFYFMEMNTRLQVEHPVTEMTTGEDLVEWQLRVAEGEPLPKRQDELAARGHAIEARIYAEDPSRGFLPSVGRIARLIVPAPSLRFDTGVREGDEITPHYDAMIGKLIASGPDRSAALEALRNALASTLVTGVATNIEFLERLLRCPDFAEATGLDTRLIERNADILFQPGPAAPTPVVALALFSELDGVRRAAAAEAQASEDPYSPWHDASGWRLNADPVINLSLREGERDHRAEISAHDEGYAVSVDQQRYHLRGHAEGDQVRVHLDEASFSGTVVREGRTLHVLADRTSMPLLDRPGGGHRFQFTDVALDAPVDRGAAHGDIIAPMPGKVIAVMVAAGTHVEKGTPLLILEAMKMEHTVTAEGSGTVKAVRYAVGDQVSEGTPLVDFE